MKSYLNLLSHILENGEIREDRTNVGTISTFGHQLKFDLRDGFPAVTTKKLAWKGVVSELIWFLEGSDDERRLAEIRYNKNRNELIDTDKYPTIWTDNADNQGKDLGYENSSLVKYLSVSENFDGNLTMRSPGREAIRQFVIYAENKVGWLNDFISMLKEDDITRNLLFVERMSLTLIL